MKFSSTTILALCATSVSFTNAADPPAAPAGTTYVGEGICKISGSGGGWLDYCYNSGLPSVEACHELCLTNPKGLQGFTFRKDSIGTCYCFHDHEYLDALNGGTPDGFSSCYDRHDGVGDLTQVHSVFGYFCYSDDGGADLSTTSENPSENSPSENSEVTGDPHFRTWKNEHFEFHGQCDLVMTKIKNFANQIGIDLEIHVRTSMVRYWSYVKTASIRIGNDVLEVEGSADKEDGIDKRHYHFNFEHLGPLTEIGGYPVTISPSNYKYTIDLDRHYPGQKIEIKTFKEFVAVKIIGATEESFGNAIGIMGDFATGNTYARDGSTILHDFNELGLEWQVLPSDGKLFHEMAPPQFPELCYLPEDPRGQRARRLAESDVSEEAAEAACAGLKDEFERKGCVYDILATQDLDMVGAY
eukprot:CAMPEP_0113614142 /NCGR_PEP_ID=MMETSP0017_2-20120614/7008_1 /TAXON_ID=2856 /ORGANISM="Cylindrotheca closterium" /LENGTH=413 /DNA_ID=CAMNT_0000523289 /DNA_START=73 /DNA_END=1314 /DNA_ORIENTATION=+ /assembly_acc=CAM_ASM_000147